MRWLKAVFAVFGLASLTVILSRYGFARLVNDFSMAGWRLFPLILTAIPVLACFSIAWYFSTDQRAFHKRESRIFLQLYFFKMTAISIAWNNLSPFVKVLGEPLKVMLLEKKMSRRAAIRSVVIYNLVHLIGTVAAFLIAVVLIPILYPVSPELRLGCHVLVIVFLIMTVGLYYLPHMAHRLLKKKIFRKIRAVSYWLRWSFFKIKTYFRTHKIPVSLGVLFEILGRFAEGFTFYYAFHILERPISALSAGFLDIGRALLDNALFFIPYQVGSREFGVNFLMRDVFRLDASGAVTAALFYRLVEISWIGIGYGLWIFSSRSKRSAKADM